MACPGEMVANPRKRRGWMRGSWENCGLGVVVFIFHSHGRGSANVLRAWRMLVLPS